MAYVITDKCVACGTCEPVCPVSAISAGDIYHIDPDTCIECGSCAEVCPSEAIIAGYFSDRKKSNESGLLSITDGRPLPYSFHTYFILWCGESCGSPRNGNADAKSVQERRE